MRRYILSNGERFATVVDETGAPAYYPTAMALAQRHRGVSVNTMEAAAADLVHIGLWALRERIDLNGRLDGRFYGPGAEEIGGTFEAEGTRGTYIGSFGAGQ